MSHTYTLLKYFIAHQAVNTKHRAHDCNKALCSAHSFTMLKLCHNSIFL